jgi:hypothetical protein
MVHTSVIELPIGGLEALEEATINARRHHDKSFEIIEEAYRQWIIELEKAHGQEIEEIKKAHGQEIEEIKKAHGQEIEDLIQTSDNKLNEYNSKVEELGNVFIDLEANIEIVLLGVGRDGRKGTVGRKNIKSGLGKELETAILKLKKTLEELEKKCETVIRNAHEEEEIERLSQGVENAHIGEVDQNTVHGIQNRRPSRKLDLDSCTSEMLVK